MNMEKLVSQYRKRIDFLNIEINELTKSIRSKRREGQGTNEYLDATSDLANDRKIADAKKMIFIQVISDLETLNES